MSRQTSDNMLELVSKLKLAKHIVIISGAGISAGSGIPTFRGAGGFWRKYQSQQLATPEAFRRSPSLVWEFYHYRRELVTAAKPNPAHIAIAELEKKLEREGKGRKLTIITQNVDGLHSRSGSKNILEIHGSLFKTQCMKCKQTAVNTDSPICEALRGRGAPDLKKDSPEIPEKDLPRCKRPNCNGLLRPGVVWFGENLPVDVLSKAEDAMEDCDLCLVVGTSSVVYPVANFAPSLAQRNIPVAEFNLETTPISSDIRFHFQGPCEVTLPEVLKQL